MSLAGRARCRVAVLALVASAAVSCAVAGTPHPVRAAPAPAGSAPPGGVRLTGWKLTLPVAGSSGAAKTLDPAAATPPWLVGDADHGLTFWAPVSGATTPHSGHARTELVNLATFRAGSGRHRLTVSATVAQIPRDRPSVIIGQIHGAGKLSAVAFVMLRYDAGALNVVVKQQDDETIAARLPLLTTVPLGSAFQYSISDDGDGRLTFTATLDGRTVTATTPLPPFFAGQEVRFQAGAYQQADSTAAAAPDDGAKVTFHGLAVDP